MLLDCRIFLMDHQLSYKNYFSFEMWQAVLYNVHKTTFAIHEAIISSQF
jgi:hypothetical protein